MRLRKCRDRRFLIVTLLLGLAFLFGAGEEISWGQRLLRVQSPEFFRAHNAQQEMNVHNLTVGGVKLNRLVFTNALGVVMVTYLLVLVPAYKRFPRLASRLDSLAIPILRIRHAVFGVLLVGTIQFCSQSSKRRELLEFGLSALIILGMWIPQNARLFDPRTALEEITPAFKKDPNGSQCIEESRKEEQRETDA